jgi:hypothetical protein
MSHPDPILPRAWNDSIGTRRSRAWWIAAVIAGAIGGIAGFYIGSGNGSYVLLILGIIGGFFAPYAAAVLWHFPDTAAREREKEWAKVRPIVRRTR